jgi:hypothetical protein
MLPRRTVLLATGLLFAAACSSNTTTNTSSTTASPPATSAPGTTPGSAIPAGVTVETSFVPSATSAQATQAAQVMTKRLTNYGFPGSTAVVNAAGTGLTITVAGATSESNALQILQPLTINGKLYFRPAVAGPYAPAAGETVSPKSAEVLGQLSPGSSLPSSAIATTPTDQDQPTGTSVLVQPDIDGNVIARWQVGPSQLDATAVSDAKVTTLNGSPAVQIVMKSGSPGIDQFNAMAKACYEKQPTCPSNVYTVVFDSNIVTATQVSPTASSFTPFTTTGVIIWSPDWTQDHAKAIAAIITVGELPVQLKVA